ncbi:MAG TPA: hypothetical protein VGB94_08030 [Acidobacteriaceae bacterium]
MAILPQLPERSQDWSAEAIAMAVQAKALSGNKLEQLVVRIQRHTGRSKEACWRFVIQHGIKGRVDHRRWTGSELDFVREEIVKKTIEEVAKKLDRTVNAVRSVLRRNQFSVREIRCDLFSVESLASALHVRKAEVISWVDQGWLPATVANRGKRRFYTITPEALSYLYKHHQQDLLKRGMRNQSLFEAYVQYCYSPKHTVGEQLLDVRRDKRERTAYAAAQKSEVGDKEADEDDEEAESEAEHRIDVEADSWAREDPDSQNE